MNNSKTTAVGILMIAAASITVVAHALGGGIQSADLQNLLSALAGLGLVLAKDAG